MKINKLTRVIAAGMLVASMTACHNREHQFPDYEEGVSVYFAYQYPVRTIVLGESETFETTLDNQHKCIIYGTMGGAYKGKDIDVDIKVDNSLVDNLYFADGSKVQAMPSSYYTLSSDQLKYSGKFMGGVEVQLTDAFFADEASLENTYVIPVVMDKVSKGEAKILGGTPLVEGEAPIRTNPIYWNVTPKDYTLYCIKYINQYDGSWLRRGVDEITENGAVSTVVRHGSSVENDEVCYLTTKSLTKVVLPITTNVEEAGKISSKTCNLLLDVAENGEISISSATDGIVASGSGKYVKDGEIKAWGNKDRDGIYINYTIDFGQKQFSSRDTLVSRSREITLETYSPEYKN